MSIIMSPRSSPSTAPSLRERQEYSYLSSASSLLDSGVDAHLSFLLRRSSSGATSDAAFASATAEAAKEAMGRYVRSLEVRAEAAAARDDREILEVGLGSGGEEEEEGGGAAGATRKKRLHQTTTRARRAAEEARDGFLRLSLTSLSIFDIAAAEGGGEEEPSFSAVARRRTADRRRFLSSRYEARLIGMARYSEPAVLAPSSSSLPSSSNGRSDDREECDYFPCFQRDRPKQEEENGEDFAVEFVEEVSAAVTLYNVAALHLELRNYDEAIQFFRLALDSVATLKWSRRIVGGGASGGRNNIGGRMSGDWWTEVTRLEIMALTNVGYCHYLREDYIPSIESFEGSVDVARTALDALRAGGGSGSPDRRLRSEVSRRIVTMLEEGMTNLARAYDAVGGRAEDGLVVIREARALRRAARRDILFCFSSSFPPSSSSLSSSIRRETTGSRSKAHEHEDMRSVDHKYIETLLRQGRGEHCRAIVGYNKCLRKWDALLRRQQQNDSGRSQKEEGEEETEEAQAHADADVRHAVRASAAMHGVASCLLRHHSSSSSRSSRSARHSSGSRATSMLTDRHNCYASSLSDARRVALTSLTLRNRFLGEGEDHRDTADSLYLLGCILRRAASSKCGGGGANNISEYDDGAALVDALHLLERASAAYSRLLGPDHPLVLAATCQAVLVRRDCGRIREALESCRSAIARIEQRRSAAQRGGARAARLFGELVLLEGDLVWEAMRSGMWRRTTTRRAMTADVAATTNDEGAAAAARKEHAEDDDDEGSRGWSSDGNGRRQRGGGAPNEKAPGTSTTKKRHAEKRRHASSKCCGCGLDAAAAA